MSNTVFGERFSKIVSYFKETLKVKKEIFADKLEVSRRTIYKYMDGEINPNLGLVEKLLALGVNPEFLTYGNEPILLEEPSLVSAKEVFEQMNKRIALDAPINKNIGTVPFVNISAMAGYRFFVQDEKENFEHIKLPPNFKSKVDYAFEIMGDSMEPYIPNNSVAYCRQVDIAEEFQFFITTSRKKIYVICTENQLMLKYVVKDSDEKLYLESANEDYPRVEINLSQIKLLFRVEGISMTF